MTTNAYDANDRITSQSGPSGITFHSYDADGNETTVNGQAATYDFENHLTSLGNGAVKYAYDADGNRINMATGGQTTSYLVDTHLPFSSVVEEYNGTALAARYDYGDDLIRMDRGGSTYYYLYDGHGSTRQLTSGSGNVTDTYAYDAFGDGLSHVGNTTNLFLFNAQQFDQPTGDYYMRARYYDQSNGRFLSQDPFEGYRIEPQSLHRYVYSLNDPVDYVDPTGADSLAEISVAGAESVALDGFEAGATQSVEQLAGDSIAEAEDNISAEGLLERGASDITQDAETDADTISDDMSEVVRKGKEGEDFAEREWDFEPNKEKIDDPFRPKRYRKPDQLDHIKRIIGEVKNVARLDWRSQLRVFYKYAQDEGYTFVLYVRLGTKLAPKIAELEQAGKIIVNRMNIP